ncbi:DUF402 domain-containing protein [Macrococcus equipercicus]|uniref:DUF402 domain-containing protein n=1 Tax=Macrococcus equipercicus TaxID=69967 RepID=A0A9Q9F1N8_9STAP|nr:DUF402 domain-containing protein [Macrococcus equipercicus]KAA1042379.1 DUF402 domain-containing protein [Macrococcus equipercicus]UTH14263.1 DUF402 domain-containing protein [Macrococcus equipercicus]
MKIKYIDKRHWRRLQRRDYKEIRLEDTRFDGIVGLVTMQKVKSPLQVEVVGKCITVADAGYQWLQLLPKDKLYSITAMYDNYGRPVQYYIDVNDHNFIELGEARANDLFLDVLVLPTGEYELVDEADLKFALKKGSITKKQYDSAYQTAHYIMTIIQQDFETFKKTIDYCRQQITPSGE